MAHFLPHDDAKAEALVDRLSKTLFQSPATFVDLYNSGLINKRHKDVLALVKELKDTYRDVKDNSGRIIFISQEEIFIEEMLESLSLWAVVVKLKAELHALLQEETFTPDATMVFTPDHMGIICRLTEEEEVERAGQEKHFGTMAMAERLHSRFSSLPVLEEDDKLLYPFEVSDIQKLDESFIERMRQQLAGN